MKKSLTKLIASCAAVAAVSTAMAVSASAAATYENGVLSPSIQSNAAVDKQATVLVYAAKSAEDEATADNIVYIDQQAMTADGLWKTINVTLADDTTYVIKMGGEGAEVASELYGEPAVKVIKGEITGDGNINASDATAIIQYFVNKKFTDKVTMANAEITGDGNINASDATAIIQYFVNKKFTDKVGIEVDA